MFSRDSFCIRFNEFFETVFWVMHKEAYSMFRVINKEQLNNFHLKQAIRYPLFAKQ